MENYVLYEETDRYANTIVYKGRKKGEISFVSIYCIEKCRRPEVTNRVRLTYEISHKNIVKFFEWYETNNHLWLVVELCSGGTLERIIQQDSFLPEDVTLRFASHVVAGLYHCHSLGILFGPLRPSRVLLDSMGVFKLADFGMAKLDSENLVDVLKHQFCEEGEDYEMAPADQTDAYRAPELESNFDWSVASDLYSLGTMLYNLFTGVTPSPKAALQWHGNRSSRQPQVSDEFKDLVSGLLISDPLKRYTWSDILTHAAFGDRLATLANDGHTLLDSETATLSGDEGDIDETGNQGEETPRASQIVINEPQTEDKDHFDDNLITMDTSNRQTGGLVDLNANRPPTACGRAGLLAGISTTGKSANLMTSRPSTAGRLTPCQALDSGPVETRTARTPQHPMTPAVQPIGTNTDLLGCGYDPDETVGWCNLQFFHESDLAVTAIIGNQRIIKSAAVTNNISLTKFDPKLLPVAQTNANKLASMSERDRTRYVTSLLDNICGANEKGPISAKRVNHINYSSVLLSSSSFASDCFVSIGGISAILKMIRETNQTVENKQRLYNLIGVVCSRLSPDGIREDSKSVSEIISACNAVGELLRDSYHQRSIRLVILPAFGELVYALVRCTPVQSADEVHSSVATIVLRSLKETDCAATSHYAAKIVENVMACPKSATGNSFLRRFLTGETVQSLWALFSNTNVEALKISCSLALSRILLHDSAMVGPLLDVVSLAGILDPLISSQTPRIHQSLITVLCLALCRLPKLTTSKEVLDALLFEMEHASPIVRAKAYLGFSMVVHHNADILIYCTQSRLSSHLERDFQKAVSPATRHEYLEHGVTAAVSSLATIPSKLNKQAINVLRQVSLKQHPTTGQTKQLNAALPGVAVVAYLIGCSLIRQQSIDSSFIADMVELSNAVVDAVSATNSGSSFVASSQTIMTVIDDLRQGVLASLEATVQSAVSDQNSELSYFPLLEPLGRFITSSKDSDLQSAGLRLLTDLLPAVFKVQKSIENMKLSDLLKVVQPTLDELLVAFSVDPLPTLSASFLLGASRISPTIVKLLSSSPKTLNAITQSLENYRRKPTTLVIQNLLELLDVILAQPNIDLKVFLQAPFIETVIDLFAALAESGGINGTQIASAALDPIARPLFATLSIVNNLLRHVALVARRAIQARQQGNASVAQEAAEEALKCAKALTGLDSYLVSMLMIDDAEMVDIAANILSLSAQLYGPIEMAGTLTEDNIHVWIAVLSSASSNMASPPPPNRAKSLLRTLRRLIQQSDSVARQTAVQSGELVLAIEKLSTISYTLGSSTTSSDTATLASEAANVAQLATEIVASLAK